MEAMWPGNRNERGIQRGKERKRGVAGVCSGFMGRGEWGEFSVSSFAKRKKVI